MAPFIGGKIADILCSRGELEEALRIRREEQLPVYERLGDVRSRLIAQTNLALTLVAKNELQKDAQEVMRLLKTALTDAERLRIPEAETIRGIIRQLFGGETPERVEIEGDDSNNA